MSEETTNHNFTDPFAAAPDAPSFEADKDSLIGFKGDLEFTEILGGFTQAKPLPVDIRKIAIVVVAFFVGAALLFTGFEYGVPLYKSIMKEQVAIQEVRPQSVTESSGSVTQVDEDTSNIEDSFGFVTTLEKPRYTKNRRLTVLEEKLWMSELAHPYPFRRFKSVYEARRQLYAGSDNFFVQGLEQDKFWTRMQAIFALADMGANVSAEHVQRAIGDARPYILKNYFKRFKKVSTVGERYVMSLAMFFVDSDAQAVIGDILLPYQSGVN